MDLNSLVWEKKIDGNKIKDWLRNFKKDKEKKVALNILSKFTYYNENEVRSLLRTSYQILKNRLLLEFKCGNDDGEDIVGNTCCFVGTWEKPSKSGSRLLYDFQKVNGLKDDIFFPTVNEVPKDADCVIFFDDIIGSGRQAAAYWYRRVVEEKTLIKKSKFFYLALIGTKEGINLITESTSMPVLPAVVLDDKYKLFSNNSIYFNNALEKNRAREICMKYGKISEPKHPLGFNNSQLLIGFHHNIPDNTLPIIWSNNNGWHPIFPRNEVLP